MEPSSPIPGARFVDPAVLARIGNLELVAKAIVDGFINGLHKAPFYGSSVDFAEHRGYVPGDDVRRIDWRVFARTERFYVKEYEADTNANFSVLLDMSKSMDFGTRGITKFEYGRILAGCLTNLVHRQRDRVGLVVFGSNAHVQAPPSFDLPALSAMVEESFVGLAGEGTALGDAIALGVARLRAMPRDERVLVLLTDGSSTEGVLKVPEAAKLARAHGVRVHAIGLGEILTGAKASPGVGLDEPALKEIAALTGGHYFRAGDARALERIYETLGRREPTLADTRQYRPAAELYSFPLALALLCAAAALALAWRRQRA